jgi:hypothetical protein
MPNFNKDAANRGNEVVERGTGGGNFRPFLSKIYWKEADDSRFILILNPLEEIVRLKFHPFVETDEGGRDIIARTDPGIGERVDPIEDSWGYTPRVTDLMIAVELEPIYETKIVNKRERQSVTGFGVVTRTIERRIRDEAGELTDDKEEVEIPIVGYITQSPFNFGNLLNAYENNENPIHLTPFKVTQVGAGSGKTYSFDGYPDATFDLTNLFEYIENISYVSDPDELIDLIDGLEQEDAGVVIGQYLLDLKINELADPEYYDEIFKAITKPSRFQKETKSDSKSARPKRSSQRATPVAKTVVSDDEGDVDDAPDIDDTPSVSNKPVARSRKPGESKSSPSSARTKLEELKALQAIKAAA